MPLLKQKPRQKVSDDMVRFPFKDISDCRVTCIYGKPGSWASGKHDGIDLVSDGDKTILSVAAGKVIRAGWNDSWGYYMVVTMADGRSLVYAHMIKGSLRVIAGDIVTVGQELGAMGSTGHSTGPHLHIELQRQYYKSGRTDNIAAFLGIENEVGSVTLLKQGDDEEVTRYKKLSDIPNNYGQRDIIEELMNKGVIKGDGSDKSGNDDVIDLSDDMVRMFIMNYRAGLYKNVG